jgi:hypothetical protein
MDTLGMPSQGPCALDQGILIRLALAMLLHLSQGRLTHVDGGVPVTVVRRYGLE